MADRSATALLGMNGFVVLSHARRWIRGALTIVGLVGAISVVMKWLNGEKVKPTELGWALLTLVGFLGE